jgi:hypothetical protein
VLPHRRSDLQAKMILKVNDEVTLLKVAITLQFFLELAKD